MTDFPTVGLKVDLTGLEQGRKGYRDLKKEIEGVGTAADATSTKVQNSARRTRSANTDAAKSEADRARAAEKARRDEERAEARATREKERQRRYLQQVRIRSIQMEEAARRAAEMEEARANARRLREAERVAREQERLAKAAARVQEQETRRVARTEEQAARQRAAALAKAERETTRLRQQEARKREAEEKRAAAEAEKNARYLQQVRINSIRMEEEAVRRAARERERAAREAARVEAQEARRVAAERAALERSLARRAGGGGGGGGGGVPPPSAGGAGRGPGAPVTRGDLAVLELFNASLLKLRHGLTETRRLFLDVRTAIGVFLAGMVVAPIFQMADAMTALRARAGAFTEQASDVPYLMEAIYKTAQRSRTPLEAIGTLYTRLAPLAGQLGKSQLELLRISETVAKAAQVGGATAAEATSAAQQLAQALASNRLGGDELRSLAENEPILVQQIAKALNMNTGQFIKWAHEGKANAAVIVDALEKAASEVDRLFGKFPITVNQSITLVRNALSNLVAKVDEMTGASRGVAMFIAQFAGFLESERTISAVAKGVELLGVALKLLGQAFSFVAASWPVIAAVLAGMGFAKLMAIVRGWQALRTAMLAYAAASAVAGRATATMIAAQSLATSAMVGTRAAVGALVAMLGGPLGVALIAAAAAFAYFRANAMDSQEALRRFEDANDTAANAIQRAIAFMEVYGGSTKELTDYLLELNGIQDEQVKGLDDAGRAAVARAANERTLTAALLDRAAAESISAAASLRRSVVFDRIEAGYRKFTADIAYPGSDAQKRRQAQADAATQRGNFKEELASRLDEQATRLPQLAQQVRNTPLNVTTPNRSGPAAPGATRDDARGRNRWEGAMDQIARMRAEVEGLQKSIDNLSANPLAALNEQIIAAGNEAAARMEAGNRQNDALADEARQVAMQKERLTILRQLMAESAENERQINQEAESYRILSEAQVRSTNIMKDFWGAGGGSYEQYTAALERSRDVLVEAEIREAQLAISRRYGVSSLDQIAEALVKYTGATEENAQRLQDQAMAEAEAAEAAIRRKAALDAIASADEDFAKFNEQTFEGLERALDHMATMADGLGESLAAAFGKGGRAAQQMLRIVVDQQRRQLEGRRRVAEAESRYGKDSVEHLKVQGQVAAETDQARIQGYGLMLGAAKTFFKENSAGYKVLTALEIALHTLTTLNTIKQMALDSAYTAASVGNSGIRAAADGVAAYAKTLASLPFPFNLAAGAAVLAALASVGVLIGGGGGGGNATPIHEERQKRQGTGTVLGDAAAKSESIARSLEIVAANSNEDLEFSNAMLVTLRSIDTNIGSLTAALARQLNVGGFLNEEGLGLGKSRQAGLAGVMDPFGILRSIPIVGGLFSSLFGTTKKVSLADAGLQFGSGTLGGIVSGGVSAQTYQDIVTQTKKKAFGITYSNKTRTETRTGAVDDQILAEINRVIASLREGVLTAAGILGVEGAAAALDAMQVNLGKISFKDMTGEEIEAALQAVFSALGDQMAETALPALAELQKAGEGAFETLIRVARNYQVLDTALKSIGMTFGAVGVSSLKARENLIELAGGIDELVSAIDRFAEDYLSESERMLPVITAVYTELGKLGFGSINTKDQFKQLVLAQDLTTESGRQTYATLLKLAPAFSKVVDYMDSLKTTTDAVADAQQDLIEVYEREAERLQGIIDAWTEAGDTLISVYQEQGNAILETQRRFEGFMETLRDFRQSLEIGPLASNSPLDAYNKSKQLFESTAAAALRGDETAIANLPGAGEEFLRSSQQFYAGTEPYFRDLDRVKQLTDQVMGAVQGRIDSEKAQLEALNNIIDGLDGVLDGVVQLGEKTYEVRDGIFQLRDAQNLTLNQALAQYGQAMIQGEIAKQQLEELKKQVEATGVLKPALNDIAAAINNLAAAQAEQSAALVAAVAAATAAAEAGRAAAEAARNQPTTPTTPPANDNTPWNATGYLANNPDIQAAYNDLVSRADRNSPSWDQHGLDSAEQFATWHWQNQGQFEQGRRWANGGAFGAGGSIIDIPTTFARDTMAEEGPEAIVPLARTASGRLGVEVANGGADNKAVVGALNKLTYEVQRQTVVAQEGHRQTISAVKELVEETFDSTAQARRNQAAAA